MKRKTNKLLGLLFASLMLFTILVGVVAMQQTAYAAAPKIQQVTLSDIQVPVVGDSLDSTYTVPAGAAYEKYVTSPKITWTKQSDPYAVSCAEGETVKAGATYYATVELHSKSDSPFDGANPITITVNTLHGSDAVDHKIVDTKYSLSHDNMVIEIKLTFRACSVYDYTFAFTNAPGVTHGMPKDGEHPWTAEDVVPVTQITDLNMLSLSWYRGSSQIYQQYTFQKENSYRLEFYLEDGFTAIIKPGTTIAYYDDETGLYFDGELGTDGIVKMEPTFKPIDPVLHEITLCGFTDPVADDTVQAHTKVWADTPMYGPEFALTGQTWHVSPSGGALPQSYTFEGNKSYFCEYILTPENGYSFDSSVKVTLKDRNGYAVTLDTVKLLSDGTLQIRTTSFDVVGGVDMVRVYDYIPPTVGMTASSCYPIISSSAPYEFSQRQWHNQTDNVNMSDSDVFEAGKSYYLNLTFKAKSGYSLSGATQITMTAKYTDGLVDMFSPSFISGVLVCSTKTEKAVRQAGTPVMYSLSYHNGIVVNGYRDPVAGDTAVDAADMLSVPDGDGYEVSFVRWVNEDFTALGKNVKLEAGKKYGLYVELAPLDGYYFAVEQNINNLHLYDAYTTERVTDAVVMWEGANERAFGQIPGTGNLFFYTYPTPAAELIDFVQFYLDEPVAGTYPDYTPLYPEGAHYYSSNDLADPEDPGYYTNDINWDYMYYGEVFYGNNHYLDMEITSEDSYVFPGDTSNIAVTVNGYEIQRYPYSISTGPANKLALGITFDPDSFRYKVLFANLGHGLSPVSQYVLRGATATKPADPTEEGWAFEGWYTDPACTQAYNFSTPVTTDIILYAKWTESRFGMIRQATASFEGKIILNFYLLLSDDVLADNGAYVLLTGGSQNRKILVKDAAVKVVNGETRYCFTYPVVAKELRDNINLKIYDSNDSVIKLTNVAGNNDYTTSGVNYSLMTYCTKMLESSTSSQTMKDLAQATIDYGTAAQIYFNYNAVGLSVGDRVTSVTLADLEQYKGVFSGSLPTGVTKRTLTALFEEDNSLRIYFTYDSGYTPDMYTYTIDGKSAPIHVKHGENGDEYYLEVKGVQSNKLGKTHDLTISNGSTTYKITVSVLTYARSSVSNGTTDRQNLGKALYRYYFAAKAMFGE